MTTREQMIEKTKRAMAEADGQVVSLMDSHTLEFMYGAPARAALAAFEEAHAPTCAPMCEGPCSPACEGKASHDGHEFCEARLGCVRGEPSDDDREALARLIDPEAWRDVQPNSTAFYDDEEAQKRYEGFFWEGVQERRAPSLAAADRVLGFRGIVEGEPSDEAVRAALLGYFPEVERQPELQDWGKDTKAEGR